MHTLLVTNDPNSNCKVKILFSCCTIVCSAFQDFFYKLLIKFRKLFAIVKLSKYVHESVRIQGPMNLGVKHTLSMRNNH